jgi:hypothetical protein
MSEVEALVVEHGQKRPRPNDSDEELEVVEHSSIMKNVYKLQQLIIDFGTMKSATSKAKLSKADMASITPVLEDLITNLEIDYKDKLALATKYGRLEGCLEECRRQLTLSSAAKVTTVSTVPVQMSNEKFGKELGTRGSGANDSGKESLKNKNSKKVAAPAGAVSRPVPKAPTKAMKNSQISDKGGKDNDGFVEVKRKKKGRVKAEALPKEATSKTRSYA